MVSNCSIESMVFLEDMRLEYSCLVASHMDVVGSDKMEVGDNKEYDVVDMKMEVRKLVRSSLLGQFSYPLDDVCPLRIDP